MHKPYWFGGGAILTLIISTTKCCMPFCPHALATYLFNILNTGLIAAIDNHKLVKLTFNDNL